MESLGYESDPWRVEAVLNEGPEEGKLLGTNPVDYVNGSAQFTDLSVTKPGTYSLSFRISYPDTAPDLAVDLGYSFR